MSLHKEHTPTCDQKRLTVASGEQQTFSPPVLELSDQDLQEVVGGDGPSGLLLCHRRNRLAKRSAPGGAARPPVGPAFPWFPGFPRDWYGSDDPTSFLPDDGDELGGFWSLWDWL